jgi:hypothetical protein
MTTFKENESYLHKLAKVVLADWLKDDFIRIEPERMFCMNGEFWFATDLTCYTEEGVKVMYEIVHTHDIDLLKLWRMDLFLRTHNWNVTVYRIDATWIMSQTGKPDKPSNRIILTTETI